MDMLADSMKAIAAYDNIAIVVLVVMCILQWVVIGRLLGVMLKVTSSLQPLLNAITILNERLNKHD